jgi:glutamine amidotransferase
MRNVEKAIVECGLRSADCGMHMIAVIDYHMGNLRSVQKGIEKVGFDAVITSSPQKILDAEAIVLPGVGAFQDCMKNLDRLGLIGSIIECIRGGKPFLGICLGTQILFSESEEFGSHEGLGIIKGKVKRFPGNMECNFKKPDEPSIRLKIPHMGWNTVKIKKESLILGGIGDNPYFYFVHSYYVEPEEEDWIIATTNYGIEFASLVGRDHIFACQFHPEKSQGLGLKVLKNFGDFVSSVRAYGHTPLRG